jgi:pimeloyl-ACP methyl ester carboxylesterase
MNATFTEKTIMINNSATSYIEAGPVDAPAIVFIHSIGLNKSMWNGQISCFSESYRAIAFDIKGHGNSATGDFQYTMDQFAEDLATFLNKMNIPNAILCGTGLGGYIALRAINLFPEKVSGLILCDTNSYADSNKEKAKRYAHIKLLKSSKNTAFAADTAANMFCGYTMNYNAPLVSWALENIEANNPMALIGTLLAIAGRADTSEFLKKITVPTLIIAGERDSQSLPMEAQYLNHFIAGSSLKTIAGAGKLSNLEQADQFNANVAAFMAANFSRMNVGEIQQEDFQKLI